ncbi:hypothetical protein SAY86_002590 [Trapa natans]|uniref:Uncharacterized protein n=1 Tax=Trapa natans TaxID=22666 RepID=A0AAN7LTT3_TRANT|nr:hypothetical protein SAY86_002590 [Trapa natans]
MKLNPLSYSCSTSKPPLLGFTRLLSLPNYPIPPKFPSRRNLSHSPILFRIPSSIVHLGQPRARVDEKEEAFADSLELQEEDLSGSSTVYRNTLRLVECSMFSATAGLIYFLSNSLSIEVRDYSNWYCGLLSIFIGCFLSRGIRVTHSRSLLKAVLGLTFD